MMKSILFFCKLRRNLESLKTTALKKPMIKFIIGIKCKPFSLLSINFEYNNNRIDKVKSSSECFEN